jgi:hypothetical protein
VPGLEAWWSLRLHHSDWPELPPTLPPNSPGLGGKPRDWVGTTETSAYLTASQVRRRRVAMTKSRFDYENNRWAGGNAALARRWYKELERTNPENVRASLDQTAGSRGAIPIGEVSMTVGFARDWLAWHDQQKAVREAGFRRWQFIASASVLLAAIGLALKAWLKW